MLNIKMNGYKRIRKNEARRRHNEGETIYLLPCMVYPDDFHPWIKPYSIEGEPFDKAVNAFEYYNCNSELGYYTAFYIKEV